MSQSVTVVSRSSQAIRVVQAYVAAPEPELLELTPAEPTINRNAYELWLEDMLSHLTSSIQGAR